MLEAAQRSGSQQECIVRNASKDNGRKRAETDIGSFNGWTIKDKNLL